MNLHERKRTDTWIASDAADAAIRPVPVGRSQEVQPHGVCDVFLDRAATIRCDGTMHYSPEKNYIMTHKYAHTSLVFMFLKTHGRHSSGINNLIVEDR
jgi:hypothetical protein